MDMKTKIQLFAAFLLLAVGALWLTSCSSEDAVQGSGSQADASLTLTINTGKVGSRATNWTSDPASTDKTQTENKINNLTIGIFSSDGSAVKTIVELTAGQTATTSNGNTLSADGTTAKIVTTSLATGDQVLVAVNAPARKFAGVSNVSGFEAVQEDAKNALTDGSSEATEIATNIPMYGKNTLSGTGSNFTASVSVQHQLAKITLDDLSVAFDANGPYKDAEFTPTEFFLVNVPTSLAFNNAAWVSSASHLHGLNTTTYTSITPATEWGTYKEYLSTGTLTASALSSASASFNSKAFFYATPNANDNSASKNMKLIIAGKFKASSSDTETTVFYPVAINANYDASGNASAATNGGTDVYKVYPNKNYKCKVFIKTKGTTDPTKNLDPQTATVTVTVTDFVDASQTTTFE